MSKHFLTKKAHWFEGDRRPKDLENARYDDRRGVWIDRCTGQPIVQSDKNAKLGTKKADLETGEDLKGE